MIRIKRAYESPSGEDGSRFLVDALWPRGVKKDALHIEAWLREVAPSKELRQWFAHEPSRWAEFKRRYSAELKRKPAAWRPLLDAARKGNVTLVFGARDTEHNNAAVLKDFLKQRLA
jgi:uncharacterized protein YeaO (DUF488 family)